MTGRRLIEEWLPIAALALAAVETSSRHRHDPSAMMKPLAMNAGLKAERPSGCRSASLVPVANRRDPRPPWSAPPERRYGVRGRCPVCPPGQAGEGNGCGRWPPWQGLYLLDSEKSFPDNGTESTVGFADTGLRVGRRLNVDKYWLSGRKWFGAHPCRQTPAGSLLTRTPRLDT